MSRTAPLVLLCTIVILPVVAGAGLPTTYLELASRWSSFDGGNCTSFMDMYVDGAVDHTPNGSFSGANLTAFCDGFVAQWTEVASVVDRYAAVNLTGQDTVKVAFSYITQGTLRAGGPPIRVEGMALMSVVGTPAAGYQINAIRNWYPTPSPPPAPVVRLANEYVTYAAGDCAAYAALFSESAVAYVSPNTIGLAEESEGRPAIQQECAGLFAAPGVADLSFVDSLLVQKNLVMIGQWQVVQAPKLGAVRQYVFTHLKLDQSGTQVTQSMDMFCGMTSGAPCRA